MALFHTLRDDFTTDQLATLWPDSFGTRSVTGGRLRIACDTGFSAAQSDNIYELTGSKVLVQVFPPALGGATTDCLAEMFVVSATGGTDAGFSLNLVTGILSFLDRVGFSDASPTTVTYSSTTHRWWKLERTGGNLIWSTSPDGDTWTTRRTSTAPAWSSGTTLAVNLLCHRNNGTNDFGEFDNFNVATVSGALLAGSGSTAPTISGVRIVNGVLTAGSGSIAATMSGQRTVFGVFAAPLSMAATIAGVSSAIEYEPPARRALWRILTGSATGGYEQELTEAQQRKLTVRLKDPSDLTFGINGRHPQAALIDELTTDAHVLWTSAAGVTWNLFRGRVGTTSDTLTPDDHRMTVSALDYRSLLDRRRMYSGTALNNNPGFEAGLTSWTGAGGTFELDDSQRQDGAKSGRLTPDGVSGTVSITSDNIAVTAGLVYRLSGWMRGAVTRDITFHIDWINGGGGTISSSGTSFSLDAETWERVDEDAIAPVGAVNARIVLFSTGTPPATDILWLDDARLTKAPQHASKLAWTNEDQADIAWGLIADTQARVGGDLGIVNASDPTGIERTRLYQVGDSVGERIKQLGETEGGFDWDILPISASALQFQIWHEQRGVDRGVVLEYGGLVTDARREVQPGTYANAIRYTGDTATTTASERESDTLATDEQGRMDAVFGDSGLTTQSAVDDRAHYQMKQSQVIRPAYQVDLARDAWQGPDHIWVGDPVRLVVYSGRLQVDTTLRVYEISFGIDGDGGEDVQLSLNPPPPDPRRMPSVTDRRLTNLERR